MSALTRRRFLAVTAFSALARPTQAAPADWQGVVMGADARLTLHGPPGQTGPALTAALARMAQIEDLFSLYRPGSALSRLNAGGRLDDPDPDFLALLRLAGHVHALTEGRFDPTVQPLWRALAEGGDPGPARALIGWDGVRITADRVQLAPGQALTLNGIAQGFAADAVRAVLAQHGLTRALVDLGEFAALGGPWRVGVSDPGLGLVLDRRLQGNAIATSSPTALMLGAAPHILDPAGKTAPIWSTLSVEAENAALADGLSTALCLADRAALAAILRRAGPAVTRITAIAPNGDLITEVT
ncbi:FAD:protein FMN transferase [Paracoccus zhejiangensis]|uniref:FAD:protein FMN transferase n=1 Tax=Paracoccus zhejiangensis TaxID=1077935 RepID=A0A2H5F0A4_9RHOB|nr:FAD:protein FMN transferase [Paracoccus zhejiangensis]AUH64974.1 nosX [Paracoccus zhejiangensis]